MFQISFFGTIHTHRIAVSYEFRRIVKFFPKCSIRETEKIIQNRVFREFLPSWPPNNLFPTIFSYIDVEIQFLVSFAE